MHPTCRASIGGTTEVESGRRHVAHTMPANAHSQVRRISERDRGFRAAFPDLICSAAVDERGCGWESFASRRAHKTPEVWILRLRWGLSEQLVASEVAGE
jgi:hypothetical protein